MIELLLRKYKAVKYIHKKTPLKMLAWVLNTPLLFEESSNVLFFLKDFLLSGSWNLFNLTSYNRTILQLYFFL